MHLVRMIIVSQVTLLVWAVEKWEYLVCDSVSVLVIYTLKWCLLHYDDVHSVENMLNSCVIDTATGWSACNTDLTISSWVPFSTY